ncbi:MAG TPA: DapH/DapD/GlmU-related protein [Bacteroidales bacterium]|nr:DapH/DapD/GlmU-related protein [Bacteroidales bacterium]
MVFNPYLKKFLKIIYPILPAITLRRFVLILAGYKIGNKVYLPSSLKISDLKTRKDNVFIGDRVSIGPNVLIITDSSPNYSKLIKIFPVLSQNVEIDNDSWIGANVTILPGVKIGKCSVVGAGSIVTKNIPDNSIAVGNPAKVIKNINPNDL